MVIYTNDNVRRQDRLLDETSAMDLLKNGEYGVLSLIESSDDQSGAYGIPLNYVWDGGQYLYFHCAPEGHKLDCIATNPKGSFCIIGRTNVISAKFTTAYESIILRGEIQRGLSSEEKMKALELILRKYSPNDEEVGLKYAEKSFHRTEILRLDIRDISGKTKQIHK